VLNTPLGLFSEYNDSSTFSMRFWNILGLCGGFQKLVWCLKAKPSLSQGRLVTFWPPEAADDPAPCVQLLWPGCSTKGQSGTTVGPARPPRTRDPNTGTPWRLYTPLQAGYTYSHSRSINMVIIHKVIYTIMIITRGVFNSPITPNSCLIIIQM